MSDQRDLVVDAERKVLGAMMLGHDAVEAVTDYLGSGSFYLPRHGAIYAYLIEAWICGEPTEPVALARRLADAGELGRAGGAAYLADLYAGAPLPAQAGYYAQIVAAEADRRQVAVLAAQLDAAAKLEDPGERQAKLAELRDAFDRAASGTKPGVSRHAERLRAALLDDAGLDRIPDPQPLVRGLIFQDTLVWLQGRPGHGKSFVALDWAASVSTGEPWQGYPVTQGPVLYLIAEGGSGFKKRVRAWKAASGRDDTGIRYLPVAVQSSNAAAWSAFCQLAAELRPVLIVIDTQARVTTGMEENTSRDMSTFVDRCEDLRTASGATIMLIHHQGRTGEHLRGHSSMEGAATTIVRVERTDETIKLTCVKQKDEPDFDDIHLRLVPTESSAVLALTSAADGPQWNSPAVKKMLSEWWRIHESDPVSVAVLVKSGAVAEATFHRSKKALVKAGLITPEGKGRAVRYKLEKNPDE